MGTRTFCFQLIEHVERQIQVEAQSWKEARDILGDGPLFNLDASGVFVSDVISESYRGRIVRRSIGVTD